MASTWASTWDSRRLRYAPVVWCFSLQRESTFLWASRSSFLRCAIVSVIDRIAAWQSEIDSLEVTTALLKSSLRLLNWLRLSVRVFTECRHSRRPARVSPWIPLSSVCPAWRLERVVLSSLVPKTIIFKIGEIAMLAFNQFTMKKMSTFIQFDLRSLLWAPMIEPGSIFSRSQIPRSSSRLTTTGCGYSGWGSWDLDEFPKLQVRHSSCCLKNCSFLLHSVPVVQKGDRAERHLGTRTLFRVCVLFPVEMCPNLSNVGAWLVCRSLLRWSS